MKTIRSFFQREGVGEGQPFYFVITLLLLITSALILFEDPSPLLAARLPLFASLMALHLTLHWLSGFLVSNKHWQIAYLVGQGLLALSIVYVSQSPELTLVLYAALIGEALGLLGLTRLTIGAVIGYLLLTVFSFYFLGGMELLSNWASPAISTIVLLIIFMILYRRQTEARDESQRLLTELESAHYQLANYASQVESLTLSAERQRMARELHDTLAQGVAGLILQLEAANAHLENKRSARAQTIIQQSMKHARNTLAEARAAIDDLRMENSSLAETIQQRAERFTQATGIPCHLTLDFAPDSNISPIINDHAERIISEGLSNIARHAQAENVWLNVKQTQTLLTIDLRDDGLGFEVENAIKTGHYGLLGLRERARLVKGSYEISSAVGQGTQLKISLPVEAI